MTLKLKMIGSLMASAAMLALVASAAQAQFTSAAYPATITGTSSKSVLHAFGSTSDCINTGWSMFLGAPSETMTIVPKNKECTAFGLPATVDYTSCDYLWHKKFGAFGTQDVACSKAGDSIDINVYASKPHGSPICQIKLPAQTGKSGFTFSNTANGTITVSGSVNGLTATQTRGSIFCPAGTHTTTASITFQAEGITLTGNNGAISVH